MVDPVLSRTESYDVAYEFTKTTFRKTSRLPLHLPEKDGSVFIWARSWNHERIGNEARALQLIARETTIPVPKLLDHGTHEDGRQYLVTELVDGINLGGLRTRSCLRPAGQKHTDTVPCGVCLETANANAVEFLESVVFPQLARLTSTTRGIDGFVMPPQWLSPDVQPPWRGQKRSWSTLPLDEPRYIFQHGDLGAQNFIIDAQTLQVNTLIDWEYAGFYPPGMERWPGSLDKKLYRNNAVKLAPFISQFLSVEYLECYHGWGDKEQLKVLIDQGELPDPNDLRLEQG